MARTAKKTTKKTPKTKRRTGIIAKIKALVPGKKATPSRAIKNARKPNPTLATDPAHSPGHRHLSIPSSKLRSTTKTISRNESATNNMAGNDTIARNAASNRRIISGAALGKHGRQR